MWILKIIHVEQGFLTHIFMLRTLLKAQLKPMSPLVCRRWKKGLFLFNISQTKDDSDILQNFHQHREICGCLQFCFDVGVTESALIRFQSLIYTRFWCSGIIWNVNVAHPLAWPDPSLESQRFQLPPIPCREAVGLLYPRLDQHESRINLHFIRLYVLALHWLCGLENFEKG